VYAGGYFHSIGRQPRQYLAGIDATTADATPWKASPSGHVECLTVSGSSVYVGGFFQNVGREPRNFLAAFDRGTGGLTTWNPNVNGVVWSLAAEQGVLYAGGAFGTVGLTAAVNVAAIPIAGSEPQVTEAAQSDAPARELRLLVPNPVHASAVIRFTLAAPASVSLAIFDLAGRRVASLVQRERTSAGQHEIPLNTHGLAPGCYLCRFEAGVRRVTRKIVVVP
jgi:type IX secretion system substrate protein